MEFYEDRFAPVSPTGQYLNSSVLSLTIVAVLEFQVPIHDLQTFSLLKNMFIPINQRFSSIMVGEKNGTKKWKKVEVNVKDHVRVAIFPAGKSPEYYDNYLSEYISRISLESLPEHQPLWEVHLLPFPTTNAAGNLIFKLHHALGDGYSLIGALLSCLKRAENPSLPLTFPSRRLSKSHEGADVKSLLKRVPQVSSWLVNTMLDFGWSVLKSSVLKDDVSPIRSGDVGLEVLPMDITTMEFDLDHIKQIKTSLKVTLNDVITGVILLGTRLYMEGEEKNSGDSNSTALVLLNTRNVEGYKSISEMVKPKATMPWGNHFSFLHVPLPKLSNPSPGHDPSAKFNPLDFVFASHQIIKRKRNNAAALLTGGLLDHVRKIKGPETTARYIYNTMSNSSMGITNLIGPLEQMTLSDHPISGLYFAVAGVPQSLEITVLSYVGKLRIAIAVEKDFIDLKKLKACIQSSFDTMFKAAVPS